MIEVYNSLTRQKEVFTPIEPGKVRMYVCGITVYDYCHIGHARMFVVFDVIYRYFKARGFDVTYVRNITDIDDKIINRANENGEDFHALTARIIQAMHEDMAALGTLPPSLEPKATENIPAILSMIATLIEKGYAYQGANGDVFYAVKAFADYGRLSGKKVAELRAGERVEVDTAKRDPLDFVLWKRAKPGEPAWDSPWGEGRPGWHIECSAMSTEMLGNHFDIHGGGQDLQFPHHENEIAQSEACTGEHFVNYWIHNGFVRVVNEDDPTLWVKMSKSLDNFFTVREVLKVYRGEEIRLFMLSSHYRSPLNYAEDQLDKARAGLTRLYTALRGLPAAKPCEGGNYRARFEAAMDDDFNTAEALAVFFDLARDINKEKEEGGTEAAGLGALLKDLGDVLGILQGDPEAYLKGDASDGLSDADIEALIQARNSARANKDYAESDRIRDELKARGVVLEDAAGETRWRRE